MFIHFPVRKLLNLQSLLLKTSVSISENSSPRGKIGLGSRLDLQFEGQRRLVIPPPGLDIAAMAQLTVLNGIIMIYN
jgi:hypothetical protein